MEKKFGKLERVDLRDFWIKEDKDFTPWIAENINILGDALKMDIEVNAQEHPVGPYRADIYAIDTSNKKNIVIENQLERTDHNHLGQIITYAAVLDSGTVIWISPNFSEEHKAAFDWLNRMTDANLNFFGVEIELWRIGDSPPAPKFNIVCEPNEWERLARHNLDSSQLSERSLLLLDYWTEFKKYLESTNSKIKFRKPQPQNWMDFPSGKSGIYFETIVNVQKGWIATCLWIGGPDGKEIFSLVREKYEKIWLAE